MNNEQILANFKDSGNLLTQIAHQIKTTHVINKPMVINLIEIFHTYLSPYKGEMLANILKQYVQGLGEFFATSHQDLFSKTSVQIEISDTEIEEKIWLDSFLKEANSPYLNITLDFTQDETECLAECLVEKILAAFLDIIFHFRAYLAPAERSAINIFSKELSLIKSKLFTGLLKSNRNADKMLDLLSSRVDRYPKPIGDNLEIAEDLVYLSSQTSEFGYLADELEQQILKGKIDISPAGEVKYTPNNAPTQNLEIHLTGSLVKSLSNLVFYLRHLAKRGDYIIIDEPELNLHPNNQILMARFLGRLVNAGFKVITSTHSDYIVMEINNLIMLTQPNAQVVNLMKKYGYTDNQLLKPEQVGAYLFQENHQYSEKIQISETGLEIETIDEVIKMVNESSQDIYLTLFD